MDQIFDRFGRLLKSVFQDTEDDSSDNGNRQYTDPDMQDAWDDLDDFLKTGKENDERMRNRADSRTYDTKRSPNEELRRDYSNLEIPFGSSNLEVKKAYKRLLKKHHPDKFASDPEKLKTATLICQKLGESYTRIIKSN